MEQEIEEKIVKMWNYINNQLDFNKKCLVKCTDEGKNVSNIAIKYNMLNEIKDRYLYYFKDILTGEENTPNEDSLDEDITDEELPF